MGSLAGQNTGASERAFETSTIHAGQRPDPTNRSVAVGIFPSTAYVYESAQHIEDIASHKVKAYHYSRIANPTNTVFEDRMTELEGGIGAIATASGQAATLVALLAIAKAGDSFVVSTKLYGGSAHQFNVFLPRLGITARLVEGNDPAAFEAAIDETTKGIFVESITNPLLEVMDIPGLAEVAHRNGIPLIVDNTFGCGGYLIRPLDLGADIIVESATKWLGGHGVTLGGVVVSGGNFEWAGNPRFPELNEPFAGYHGLILTKQFGRHAFLAKMRMETQREMGATLSAQSAFQLLQGIETLPLRVDRHTSNSLALARWLEAHPKVLWVSHPSLKSHPSYEFAKKLLKRGAGGTLAFALKPVGDKPSDIVAQEWIDATLLAVHAPNLGGKLSTALLQAIRRLLVSRSRSSSFLDVRTLVVHPSRTTHRQLTKEQLLINGCSPELIRVSVGLENIDDIIADFKQAIEKVT